jgi:hypothetical protein
VEEDGFRTLLGHLVDDDEEEEEEEERGMRRGWRLALCVGGTTD